MLIAYLSTQKMSEGKINSKLHEFWKRHYTSDRMTVAVIAREPLDHLETLVKEAFSAVPKKRSSKKKEKKKKRAETEHWSDPYDPKRFHRLFRVASVQDVYELELIWTLPKLRDNYEELPLNYLTWNLGHEGKSPIPPFRFVAGVVNTCMCVTT